MVMVKSMPLALALILILLALAIFFPDHSAYWMLVCLCVVILTTCIYSICARLCVSLNLIFAKICFLCSYFSLTLTFTDDEKVPYTLFHDE